MKPPSSRRAGIVDQDVDRRIGPQALDDGFEFGSSVRSAVITSIATPWAARRSAARWFKTVGRASDEDQIMAAGGQPARIDGADAARSASDECSRHS